MFETIRNFLENNEVVSHIIEFYLIFIIVFFVVRFFSKSKSALTLVIPLGLVALIHYITKELNLVNAERIFNYAWIGIAIIGVVILTPEIKELLAEGFKKSTKTSIVRTTMDNKMAIADACMFLSSKKIGALITIEKHRLLDQYSEKAIIMDSDISKELLINIFSPLTPLHDGAVIIKGNKIRCAGAYYVLSQRDNLDKTVGSRHRAALGIAEATDSVTIVVSEETGSISIAYSGIFMKMTSKDQLLEYITLAMEREV